MQNAIAHIGGNNREDIDKIPNLANFEHISLNNETEVEKKMEDNMEHPLPVPQNKLQAESLAALEAI